MINFKVIILSLIATSSINCSSYGNTLIAHQNQNWSPKISNKKNEAIEFYREKKINRYRKYDEAVSDKELVSFRKKLIENLRNTNKDKLYSLLKGKYFCSSLRDMLPNEKDPTSYCLKTSSIKVDEFAKRVVLGLKSGGCFKEKDKFSAPITACFKGQGSYLGLSMDPLLTFTVAENIRLYKDANMNEKFIEIGPYTVINMGPAPDTKYCPQLKMCPGWIYGTSSSGAYGFLKEESLSKFLIPGMEIEFFKKNNLWDFKIKEYIQ